MLLVEDGRHFRRVAALRADGLTGRVAEARRGNSGLAFGRRTLPPP